MINIKQSTPVKQNTDSFQLHMKGSTRNSIYGAETNLSTFKKTGITQSMFWEHREIKLEGITKNGIWKILNYLKTKKHTSKQSVGQRSIPRRTF